MLRPVTYVHAALLWVLLCFPAIVTAQGLTARAADPLDVASLDAIIAAFYDVISHEAGEAVDWARDSSLYLSDTRFKIVSPASGGATIRIVDHASYARSFGNVAQAFFEREIHRVTQRFGPIVQVFSTYEWSPTRGGSAAGRGINALELYYDGRRWWISSAMWMAETPEHPIPAAYLPP